MKGLIDFFQDPGHRTALVVISVLLLAVVLTPLTRWLITRSYTAASKKLKVDPTRYRFLKNAVSLVMAGL